MSRPLSRRNAANLIAQHYGIPLDVFRWLGATKRPGLVRGRNAFLLLAALMELPTNSQLAAIGIHAGTDYSDCSQAFLNEVQLLYDRYTGGEVIASAPFLAWTKPAIWSFAKECGVPLRLTWSCEADSRQPCGECSSCRDREALDAL
jgi:7-cyano-7-deazaguanine synthase